MKTLAVVALAAIASGCLFCLALPPADVWWLGWFAFVPLLVVVREKGFLAGFGGGLLALFACAFAAKSGIFYVHKDFNGAEAWLYTGCGLFGFVVSIAMGVWADASTVKKPLWWFAMLTVALEACLLVQLPAHLALTQYRQPLILFLASLGGIWLVSFFVWLSNFTIALAIRERKYLALPVVPVALLLVAQIQRESASSEPDGWYVGVVQTEATDAPTLRRLHLEASLGGISKLVVWPEFAGLALAPRGNTAELVKLASEPGSSPLVTSFNDAFEPLPHNAAALLDSSGASEMYFKRRLFGGETKMHAPGDRAVSAKGVGLSICFDSCYPSSIRETVALGNVRLIALPTIDPESPHGFIGAVHAAFTPFRAAETGVPIARADGYAHSMVVDSDGRILAELGSGEGVTGAKVSAPVKTVYNRLGDWFLYLSIAGAILGMFRWRRSENRLADDATLGG